MNAKEIQIRWSILLNPKRRRGTTGTKKVQYKGLELDRNPFDSDYNRIAMSAPFRRLQDKAQVFPLEKNDFARTRLTHSIEVSSIARSIGTSLEQFLFKKKYLKDNFRGYIPSLLATSSLIHDIGNPPFGHFGEETIKRYFKSYFDHSNSEPKFEKEEIADFTNFDGNVQGFRLLLKLAFVKDEYSFNLTYPTLSCIVKYPKDSVSGNIANYEEEVGIEFKKYGYYQSEKDLFNEIDKTLQLNGHRHPIVFLLEASDDIAYSVSDIEDGIKKGTITLEIIKEILNKEQFIADKKCSSLLEKITKLEVNIPNDFPSKQLLIAQECRIQIQNNMIPDVLSSFMDNHIDILNGKFKKELLEVSESSKLREFTKNIANYNFNSKIILKNEILGDEVLTYLLKLFIDSVNSKEKNNTKTKEGKIFSLISNHYKHVWSNESYSNKKYTDYMLIVDYISSMTDTYALTLYQELKGITNR